MVKAHLAVLALLLAASAANAQVVVKQSEVRAQISGSARKMKSIPVINGSGARKLLGTDGATLTTSLATLSLSSKTGKICAAGDAQFSTLLTPNQQYGELLIDNAVCNPSATRGKVTASDSTGYYFGASAQDYGVSRSGWETYGWALFAAPSIPVGVYDKDRVEIQGIQLHVIGNVGKSHTSGVTCTLSGVSIAIFNASQTAPFDPVAGTAVHSTSVPLPFNGGSTFTWTSNSTAILYTDIVSDLTEGSRWQLIPDTLYWLRIKYNVPYAGSASGGQTGQCLAFWAMSSAMNSATGASSFSALDTTNHRARWQERTGGSAGYSTTCLGASDSPTSVPGQYQTFWNCWNNGISVSQTATYRRCLTFRNGMTPSIPVGDCTSSFGGAQLNDFNYAFTGYMGTSGAGGSP